MKHSPDIHARLTPAMRLLVERMAQAPYPPMHTLSAAEAKEAYAKSIGVLDVPKPELPRVEDIRIPARDRHVLRARLYAPSTGPDLPVLLYLHGGGFTIGSIESHDTLCRTLALGSGAAVVSLDYRLAPEWRFPTAVHDVWDALHWLVSGTPSNADVRTALDARGGVAALADTSSIGGGQRLATNADDGAPTRHLKGPPTLAGARTSLGLDATRLAVGGDSAGGTLAAVAAIHARDEGIRLALQLLIYPGTTDHQDTDSHARFQHGPVLDKVLIDWFFHHYIDSVDRSDWRFAPLKSAEVEGVAPAWIGLAECDPLVDEGVQYADKLRMAGVPVDLEIYRGVVHGFITMGRAIPEARQLHQDAAAALRRAFAL